MLASAITPDAAARQPAHVAAVAGHTAGVGDHHAERRRRRARSGRSRSRPGCDAPAERGDADVGVHALHLATRARRDSPMASGRCGRELAESSQPTHRARSRDGGPQAAHRRHLAVAERGAARRARSRLDRTSSGRAQSVVRGLRPGGVVPCRAGASSRVVTWSCTRVPVARHTTRPISAKPRLLYSNALVRAAGRTAVPRGERRRSRRGECRGGGRPRRRRWPARSSC